MPEVLDHQEQRRVHEDFLAALDSPEPGQRLQIHLAGVFG